MCDNNNFIKILVVCSVDQADGPNNGENRRHPLRNNFKEAKSGRRSSIITQPPDLVDSDEDDVVNQ